MTTNKRIKVSDLDFDLIRDNLKTYMEGQDTFTDYDFDGSALSVLLDVLAYNTHYNALYTNLAVNEMFLDSASKRSSIVSIANNFGYIPKSCQSSQAIINITISDPEATNISLSIPKWTPFTSSIDSKEYTFYTIQDYTAILSNGQYAFTNIEIYEGKPVNLTYVCTELDQKFEIPYENIDLNALQINVKETAELVDYETYKLAQNILELTDESKIYYLKELETGRYQIYFGSNGLGRPIKTGNSITLEGIVSSKDEANGMTLFKYSGEDINGSMTVTTVSNSVGGKDKESIDEIRQNVSQTFFDQNRTVTPIDYGEIIKRHYKNIDSVAVWGGEDNIPPVYGKVYIAIKPSNKLFLTESEENYINETILGPRGIVSITPEFVKPKYINLEITASIYYDKSKTSRSGDSLKTTVKNYMLNYRDKNLKKFNGVFRMSRFQAGIDNIDASISSNIVTLRAFYEVEPRFNAFAAYALELGNPIYSADVPEEAFDSTGFYIDNTDTVYRLDDDGVGNIRLYNRIESSGEKIVVNPKIGVINYNTGSIYMDGLKITGLSDPNFYFIIKTASNDVVSVRNQIVDIPESRIKISLVEDKISSGSYAGGLNHTFTSSRN